MADQLISTVVHDKLPGSYVRAATDRPRLDEVVANAHIPVVDLTNPDHAAVVSQIGAAFTSHGFFLVLNHGLAVETMQAAMEVAHEFFRLSPEEKAKLSSDDPAKKMRLSTSFNMRKETAFFTVPMLIRATEGMADQLISTVVHDKLPGSYVRAETDRPRLDEVVADAHIPVVDLANPDHAAVVSQIGAAFTSHGFFLVLNHGLAVETMQAAMEVAHEFFRLSPEEKAKLSSDYLRLHCYPLEQFVPDWPSNPPPFRRLPSPSVATSTKDTDKPNAHLFDPRVVDTNTNTNAITDLESIYSVAGLVAAQVTTALEGGNNNDVRITVDESTEPEPEDDVPLLARKLLTVGIVTMGADISTVLYRPASGVVFGHNKLAYYLTLAGTFAAGATEIMTAIWLARSSEPGGRRHRSSFARAAICASIVPFVVVLGINGTVVMEG